jgi:adenylate cyclase
VPARHERLHRRAHRRAPFAVLRRSPPPCPDLQSQAKAELPAPAPTATPPQIATPIPASTPTPAAKAAAAPPPPAPPPIPSSERFAVESTPFIGDRARSALTSEYLPATDHKAFALNITGTNAFVTAQPSEEVAQSMAIEQCQKRAEAIQSSRKCEIYAVGNSVVYPHGKPPVPPLPWIKHDPTWSMPSASVSFTRTLGKRSA